MHKYSRNLFLILLLKSFLLILIIKFLGFGLSPDEAQYWTWSQELDFGYYSKPPGIAWQIFTSTLLLGNNELGVRLGALIIGFLIPLAVYKIGINSGLSQRACFWSALLFAFSPLGTYLSFAATTDGGAILGITLAVAILAQGLHEKRAPHYISIGLSIAFGALFKWIAFIFYPFLLFFLIYYPWLRHRTFYVGLGLSLLALLPSLYWNIFHDFATFKHVFDTMYHKGNSSGGNFFSFLGAQLLLLSPLTFILFLIAIWKPKENRALLFCTVFSSGLLIYLIMAISKKMQPNWASYFYPTGLVLVGWYGIEILKQGRKWVMAAFVTAIIFSSLAFAYPFLKLPYQWNPLRQVLGWPNLHQALEKRGYDPDKDYLFSDTYQMSSVLSFYAEGQKRASFFNIKGSRKNQFSYWPSLIEGGKRGFFVISENISSEDPWYKDHYLEKLSSFFTKIDYLGSQILYGSEEGSHKRAFFFQCEGFLGTLPPDPEGSF